MSLEQSITVVAPSQDMLGLGSVEACPLGELSVDTQVKQDVDVKINRWLTGWGEVRGGIASVYSHLPEGGSVHVLETGKGVLFIHSCLAVSPLSFKRLSSCVPNGNILVYFLPSLVLSYSMIFPSTIVY